MCNLIHFLILYYYSYYFLSICYPNIIKNYPGYMNTYPKQANAPGKCYTCPTLNNRDVTNGSNNTDVAGTMGSNNLLISIDDKNTPKLNIVDI